MAVNQIIMHTFVRCEFLNARNKLRQVASQVRLWQRPLGAGRNMHHPVAISQVVQHMRYVLVLRAGEDIHADPHLTQAARQLTYVHIHSPRIFAAQGGQGAGVIRKHCDSQLCTLSFRLFPCIMWRAE